MGRNWALELILRSPHLSKSPRNHHVRWHQRKRAIDINLHVDMGWHCTKAIPRSIFIYFDVKSIWIKFGMVAAYIKVLGMATKAISRSKHVFIFKTGFRMSFHFQNVVLFQNALSFSKCKRFCDFCFSFFRKNTSTRL